MSDDVCIPLLFICRRLLMLSILLAACAGDSYQSNISAGKIVEDTIDGKVFVRNDEVGLWGGDGRWTLHEDWRIGTIAGDDRYMFGHITNISTERHGLTAVIDFQAQHLKVFGPTGEFLRILGGPGRGPGEFEGPLAVAWDSQNRLWVVDGWNRRYSVFDSTGSLIETIPRRVTPAVFRQKLIFTEAGTLLDETGLTTADGTSAVGIVEVDTAGAVIDTFPPLIRPDPGALASLIPFPRALNPYTRSSVYAVTKEGMVWHAISNELRLIQRTLAGDTLRVVETSHRNLSLTAADEQVIQTELSRFGLNRSGLPLGRQVLHSIHILDDGHLLVLVEDELGQDPSVFDVFDPGGRYLGPLRSAFSIDPTVAPVSRGDTLVTVSRDEFGVQYLVRATIQRRDR